MEELKPLSKEEFSHVMDTMKKANASMPINYFLSVLGDIVKGSDKDAEAVKKFAKEMKNRSAEELISLTVLTTANSIVISIWNLFGKKLTELAAENEKKAAELKKKAEEAEKAEPAAQA